VYRKRRQPPADPSGPTGTSETEVPAIDIQNDLEYVVPVKIGTPGVTLNLDFDTGELLVVRGLSDFNDSHR
jgi:hypothetical protein